MSATRDALNLAAIRKLADGKPPSERPQPMMMCAPGAGGAAARPIDWKSPDGKISLYAESKDTSVIVRLQDDCGAQVLLSVAADGTAKVRVIGCDGSGYALTPSGITQVTVTGAGTESESETTPPGSQPIGTITITACVNGVNKSITILGYVNP